MKIKKKFITLCFGTIILCLINITSVFAESYESSVGVSFTLNPTISITLTGGPSNNGDLVISNLTPGDYKDSNTITVSASSNALSGYSVSSTVGSSTNNSTELRMNGIDTTNKFTNLTSNETLLSNFDDNTWGYSYSIDSGSTWISGDITATTTPGYNGLPVYTTTSPIKLISTSNSGSSSVEFKIGAKASTNQIAGEYTNTINFIGIANPNPVPIYIQDITLASCQVNVGTNGNPANIGDNITVVDRRDNNIYTVRYINGQCWMTQNLRITGIISAEDSNFSHINNFNVSQYSLDSTDSSYANHCDSTNGYNYACAKDSGNTSTGVWYNYAAATAGTITGSSNSTDATSDICPSGWHLPSGPNSTIGTDINRLMGSTVSDWLPATSSLIAFDAIAGGGYSDGSLYDIIGSYYWTSSPGIDVSRYRLLYNGNNNQFFGDNSSNRYAGYFIHCVRSS